MTRTLKYLLLFVASFTLAAFVHRAYADPLPTLPNVTSDPAGAAAGVWSFVEHYGPLWGGVLALYLVTGPLLVKAEADHWQWLATGRRNALAHGLVNILGAVAIAHFTGASWAGVAISAVMAVSLILHPAPADALASPARNAQGGRVTCGMAIGLVLVMLGIAGLITFCAGGCGAFQKGEAAAKDAAIDCAKADVVAHLPAVTAILEDGGPTWESNLEQLGVAFGEDVLACEVRAVVAVLEQSSAAPSTAQLTATPESRGLLNARSLIARKGWIYQ